MDGGKKIASLVPFSLIQPKPREAGGGTKLPSLGILRARYIESIEKTGLGFVIFTIRFQEVSLKPVQFRFAPPFLRLLDLLDGLGELLQGGRPSPYSLERISL